MTDIQTRRSARRCRRVVRGARRRQQAARLCRAAAGRLHSLPGWHTAGALLYRVGFWLEYTLLCLARGVLGILRRAGQAAACLAGLLLAPLAGIGRALADVLAAPHPLRRLAGLLPPCLAAAAFCAAVHTGMGLTFTLQVQVNGTVVGVVAAEQDFDAACADLRARIAAAQAQAPEAAGANLSLEPVYTLHIGGQTMTETQLTDAILRVSGGEIAESTAVYDGDTLLFVTDEGDHLRAFLNAALAPWRTPMDTAVRTEFLHDLRLADGIYLAASVRPYAQAIAALQADGGELLAVKTVRTTVREEAIPYEQQTEERPDLGFGVVETVQQGQDGVQRVTEETTSVNGTETGTQVVNVEVLQQPVPEIIGRGTHLEDGMTAELDGRTFIWPVPQYRAVSRWMSASHKGTDIAAPYGTPIVASAAGTVTTAAYHISQYSYGNYVVIDHGGGYKTLYGHMSAFAVQAGDTVAQGQVIGYVGSTGYSFGNHCHFEMYGPNGRFSAQTLFPTMRMG